MREGDQRHAQAALPPGKKPVPIVQDAGKAPGPVWAGAEYLAPTGFRSPHPAVRIELLKQLRHPAQLVGGCIIQTTFPAARIKSADLQRTLARTVCCGPAHRTGLVLTSRTH